MEASRLVVWYLTVYGVSWALVHSKIFEPLRAKIETIACTPQKKNFIWQIACFLTLMLNCIVCVSFWCGLGLAPYYFPSESLLTKLSIGFSNVTFTWILANILGDLE